MYRDLFRSVKSVLRHERASVLWNHESRAIESFSLVSADAFAADSGFVFATT